MTKNNMIFADDSFMEVIKIIKDLKKSQIEKYLQFKKSAKL